jgi:HD-GYP domain-containing protein (c-di-GMP phosphodiesterase class II)
MQILLFQDNLDVREKMGFLLESTYSARVFECTSFKEALETLEKTPKIDLIIFDSKRTMGKELEEFKAKTVAISTIHCVVGKPDPAGITGNIVGIVDRTSMTENIVATINGLIAKGLVQTGQAEGGQCRIRTKLLLSVCPLKGDIYIRLNKDKFIKLFREGDIFDLADLEKYTTKKGVEYLFIRHEQCAEFAQKYKAELEKLIKSEHLNIADVAKLGESVQETVRELTTQIGFTKEVQELTKTQVQLTVKSMGKDPSLQDILKKLKMSEEKYISSHSALCSYLACAIAAQLQWGSDTTFYKLTLSSFLHDIHLNNHELAQLSTLQELEKSGGQFTPKEKAEFKEHPIVAADMAKKMSEVPPDVDVIIRQHHEKPDGTGFPRGLSHAYIAPLSVVFILAHDLAQYTIQSGSDFSVDTFLEKNRDKYKSAQFKKVLGCIEVLHKIKSAAAQMNSNKG